MSNKPARNALMAMLFACFILISGCAGQATEPYAISISIEPTTISVGERQVTFTVTTPDGKAADDVTVHMLLQMPGMQMALQGGMINPVGNGRFQSAVMFHAPGNYKIVAYVNRRGQLVMQKSFEIEVK